MIALTNVALWSTISVGEAKIGKRNKAGLNWHKILVLKSLKIKRIVDFYF